MSGICWPAWKAVKGPTANCCAARMPPLPLLAYTATFGGGFSATVSVEDGVSRRAPTPPVTAYRNAALVTITAWSPSAASSSSARTQTGYGTLRAFIRYRLVGFAGKPYPGPADNSRVSKP